jgi:hypothetical protein
MGVRAVSDEQLSLFPEAETPPTTMPAHDEPPMQIHWTTDAAGRVCCQLVAECGCEGEIAPITTTFTSHDEWVGAINEAMMVTLQGVIDLLCDHDDIAGEVRGLQWVGANYTLIRTGWETAMPFTHTAHTH